MKVLPGWTYVYEIETTPLGTGGAVRRSLERCLEDHVFVFNGDTYLDLEVLELDARWCSHGAPMIGARHVPGASADSAGLILQVTGWWVSRKKVSADQG